MVKATSQKVVPEKLQKKNEPSTMAPRTMGVPTKDQTGISVEDNSDVLVISDALDSEDDEGTDTKFPAEADQKVGKIPAISKQVLQEIKQSKGEPGVVYIGRIPHGFYEYEMRQYLSQFGPISRLRLSRNKKTGASKHFAFVEFEERSTAEIVAKTMNNYLLFGHILKCRIIPKEQVHEDLFKGANKRFKKVPWNKIAGRKLAKPLSESAWEAKLKKERTKRATKSNKLMAMGYEFEAVQLKSLPTNQGSAAEAEGTGRVETAGQKKATGDGDVTGANAGDDDEEQASRKPMKKATLGVASSNRATNSKTVKGAKMGKRRN